MADSGFVLFKRTRDVELKISEFLSNILHVGFLYAAGIEKYFDKGAVPEFDDIRDQVSTYEAKNDELRRTVEIDLYAQMILPDVRSDILRLLEGCDRVINTYEENLVNMSIEQPKVPSEYQEAILDMIKPTLTCVGTLIEAVRCFFSGKPVEELAKQVSFFEHEIDKMTFKLKHAVFSNKKLPLARQMQLRDFIDGIERLSDRAEDVADRLSVVSVKHAL